MMMCWKFSFWMPQKKFVWKMAENLLEQRTPKSEIQEWREQCPWLLLYSPSISGLKKVSDVYCRFYFSEDIKGIIPSFKQNRNVIHFSPQASRYEKLPSYLLLMLFCLLSYIGLQGGLFSICLGPRDYYYASFLKGIR